MGCPGTMLAALFMCEFYREWALERSLFCKVFDSSSASWRRIASMTATSGPRTCMADRSTYLGAGHGLAANVFQLQKDVTFLTMQIFLL